MSRKDRARMGLQTLRKTAMQCVFILAALLLYLSTASSAAASKSDLNNEGYTIPATCRYFAESSKPPKQFPLQATWPVLSASQYGGLILFCTCILTWVILRAQGFGVSSLAENGEGQSKKKGLVDFSKPSSVLRLAQETASVSGIFLFAFASEYFPLFPSTKRTWDTDDFAFYVLIFAALSFASAKKVKDASLLNRLQTDEWKGWMQWLFIMYHYCAASNIYNFIRVFICSYVWMTGYGNFIYFTTTNNFCLARFIHMMWRLNFAVVMLMVVMNKSWMVYYICPLHTFYFVLTFFVCFLYKQGNSSELVLYAKILATFVGICLMWDALGGNVFNFLWGFVLSSQEGVGGTRGGTLWEWYFRTSLDKYACAFGMLIGLNRTRVASMLTGGDGHRAAWWTCIIASVAYISWWMHAHSTEAKTEYNKTNAFFAPGVVIAFVVLRNATPFLREYYLAFPANLGRISLESYLLQYHVWLACSATRLLVFVPGMPKVNLFLSSAVFVLLANQLFDRTMSLRELLFPDHGLDCIVVLCKLFLGLLACCTVGVVFEHVGGGWPAVLATSLILAMAAASIARYLASRYALLPQSDYDEPQAPLEAMEVEPAHHKDTLSMRAVKLWVAGTGVVLLLLMVGLWQLGVMERDKQEIVPVHRVPQGQFSDLLHGIGTCVAAAALLGLMSRVKTQ